MCSTCNFFARSFFVLSCFFAGPFSEASTREGFDWTSPTLNRFGNWALDFNQKWTALKALSQGPATAAPAPPPGRSPCPNGIKVECGENIAQPTYVIAECKIELPSSHCTSLPTIPTKPQSWDEWKKWCDNFNPKTVEEGIAKCNLCNHEFCHVEDHQTGWPRSCETEEHCHDQENYCLSGIKADLCEGDCAFSPDCEDLCSIKTEINRTTDFNKCVCTLTAPVSPPKCFTCVQACLNAANTPEDCGKDNAAYCKDYSTSKPAAQPSPKSPGKPKKLLHQVAE